MSRNPKNKVTASHTTLTKVSSEVVSILQKIESVHKIGIGIIKTTASKGGKRGIKFLPIVGGVKAMVRGSGTVQELYIYTKNPAEAEEKLLQFFE